VCDVVVNEVHVRLSHLLMSYLYVVVGLYFITDVYSFCCVCFSLLSQQTVGGTSPKWPILCRVGRKTTTQLNSTPISVNGRL